MHEAGDTILTTGRLDASYDWLPAPPQKGKPLVLFGNGCDDPRPYNLAGQVNLAFDVKTNFLHCYYMRCQPWDCEDNPIPHCEGIDQISLQKFNDVLP